MRRMLVLFATVVILLGSSCAYTSIRSPLDTDINRTDLGTKTGRASNYSLMWLFAWGDASYAKAARNGDIKLMKHADQELQQYFFGLYIRQTTIVYGD